MLKDSTNENEGQIRYLEGTNYGIKLTTSNKKKEKIINRDKIKN